VVPLINSDKLGGKFVGVDETWIFVKVLMAILMAIDDRFAGDFNGNWL
jgi:hypothetical protein